MVFSVAGVVFGGQQACPGGAPEGACKRSYDISWPPLSADELETGGCGVEGFRRGRRGIWRLRRGKRGIWRPADTPKGVPEWVCRPKACGMYVYMHMYMYMYYHYIQVHIHNILPRW